MYLKEGDRQSQLKANRLNMEQQHEKYLHMLQYDCEVPSRYSQEQMMLVAAVIFPELFAAAATAFAFPDANSDLNCQESAGRTQDGQLADNLGDEGDVLGDTDSLTDLEDPYSAMDAAELYAELCLSDEESD
ncbi:hypothetical protein BGZ58_009161 [Dissophora ornata]|nr:hypothetical protein BGZ58_009161 [Dissophora ornata]